MANPFVKGWNYLMALFDSKIEENADPKVQIEQAIGDAQRQHQELSQQAASVIGNQRQLEMQLNRRLNEVEKLQDNARQALELADKAREQGDENKAREYENAAEAFASQLVTAEEGVEDTKRLHDQALQQAEQAKKAVERNAMSLREKVDQRSKLLSQLEQAKMQEKVSESLNNMNELSGGSGPSLDGVRDKIERRYAKALGQAELAENSVEGRMREVQEAGRNMKGQSRLEQIRSEMGGNKQVASGNSSNPQSIEGAKNAGTSADQAAQPSANDAAVEARLRELRGQ